jgi:hypothetical protein
LGLEGQESVAELARLPHIACLQAQAHAALGVVRQVYGVVAPPGAVVVPEVMVRIVREHADGSFFKCVHGVSPFGFLTRNLGQQKTAGLYQDRRSMKSEENFLFGLVTRTSLGVSAFANHRGISPSPVGTLTRLMRSQEFLML